MTEFQKKCLERLEAKGSQSVNELSWHMKTNRLAISSAMRSLEKKGIVGSFRNGRDQWAALCYFAIAKPVETAEKSEESTGE